MWIRRAAANDPLGEKLLLAELADLCHRSYRWRPGDFEAYVQSRGGRDACAFPRAKGTWLWRIWALVYVPLSYGLLLPSFLAWITLFGGIAIALSATVASTFDIPWPSAVLAADLTWDATKLWDLATALASGAATVLGWIACGLSAVGFFIALLMFADPTKASAQAYGFVDGPTSRPVVVFMGSQASGWRNVHRRDDFYINACVWPLFGPMRHLGFHRAWRHIAPSVRAWLAGLPDAGQVVLTGHSLGGALAKIAAFELCQQFPVAHVVSFGSSRIGNRTTRERYKQRVGIGYQPLHRVTQSIWLAGDAIPRLPPACFFKHVGRPFMVTRELDLLERGQDTIIGDYLREIRAVLQPMWRRIELMLHPGYKRGAPGNRLYIEHGWAPPEMAVDDPLARTHRIIGWIQRNPYLAMKFFTLKLFLAFPLTAAVAIPLAFIFYVNALKHGLVKGHSHGAYARQLAARLTEPSKSRAGGSA